MKTERTINSRTKVPQKHPFFLGGQQSDCVGVLTDALQHLPMRASCSSKVCGSLRVVHKNNFFFGALVYVLWDQRRPKTLPVSTSFPGTKDAHQCAEFC